ncbi:hypothetical protein [Paenibacillus thiaminolyticus]|uniref:hypothetical protein n=1 Tax=Paenibacillus thiaminolyticus TaxID=49283 RepID=UPI002543B11E|nr:hypothetical protein [Paenibacillus thiaminolyticus]WII38179.1 hypothetical protein O0V01_03260 [Paenibacillus thiaminolyticus]
MIRPEWTIPSASRPLGSPAVRRRGGYRRRLVMLPPRLASLERGDRRAVPRRRNPAMAGRTLPWSFVVKLVIPSAAAEPGHYSYWKREALAYQSGLLEELPGIRAPRCYGVEEQEAAEQFAQRCRIARCLLERAEEAIALLPEAGC